MRECGLAEIRLFGNGRYYIVETFYRRLSKTKISNIYGIDIARLVLLVFRAEKRSFIVSSTSIFRRNIINLAGDWEIYLGRLPKWTFYRAEKHFARTVAYTAYSLPIESASLFRVVLHVHTYRTRLNNYSSKSKLFLKSRIEERRKKKRDVSRKLKGVYSL